MDISRDLPSRLTVNFPRWKRWFIAFYLIIFTATVFVTPNDSGTSSRLSAMDITLLIISLMELVLSIAMIFILGPEISRRLRSPKELSVVLKRLGGTKQNRYIRMYKAIYPVFLYGFTVFIGMSVSCIVDWIANLLTPNLDETQVIIPGMVHPNLVASFFLSLLASTEEFWRWSVILMVLFLFLSVCKKRWQMSLKFRKWSFVSAIMVSSVVFGLGHADEFAIHQFQAVLVLSLMGVNLAVFAILTRRYWLALFMHGIYDFFALSGYFTQVLPYVLFIGLFAVVVMLPIILFLRSKVLHALYSGEGYSL